MVPFVLSSAVSPAEQVLEFDARYTFEDLIGSAPAFVDCVKVAKRSARSDLPILITGESGTGKEMLAQAIHNASPRASRPFVGINLAAIPGDLLESELFGYEPGAFTGARQKGSVGKFELAGEGTLLLDEIGELPPVVQAKLLRVLEERVVLRLGASRPTPFKARVLATTNRDLDKAVEQGTFRLDLYHRLRVVHLVLPPLRDRRSDIELLVNHYARLHCAAMGRAPIQVSPGVLKDLKEFLWPGNIRELANLVAAKVTLLEEDSDQLDRTPTIVRRSLYPSPVGGQQTDGEIVPLSELERNAITHALKTFDGNISEVAQALGVSRGTIYNKIKRYGIRVPRPTGPQ